jgi:hypothetical protein
MTAVIVDFYDFQARALGFKDMAEIEEAYLEVIAASVREARIKRGIERARRRP